MFDWLLTGSDPAQGWSAGGDSPRVLLLWCAQCVCAGVHPRQGRLCGGVAVSPALCGAELSQGYELVRI